MTTNTHRSLARVPITPNALPSSECLAYNKIMWPLSSDRTVLLVPDMQNYCVDMFVEKAAVISPAARLLKILRGARLPLVYCRGERAQTRFERGLDLAVRGWWPQCCARHGVRLCDCRRRCARRRVLLNRKITAQRVLQNATRRTAAQDESRSSVCVRGVRASRRDGLHHRWLNAQLSDDAGG